MSLQLAPILIVSEKKLVRSTLGSGLEKAGFKDIRTAESAEDALVLLQVRAADVVVTEWMMNGMDGIELTRKIKECDQALERFTAVLIYSARDNPEDIVAAYQADIHDFICKPVNHTVLAARIAAAARVCGLFKLKQTQTAAADAPAASLPAADDGALQDPETGAWNQTYFRRQLLGMLKNSRLRRQQTACAVIGIDEFNRMAHSYGKTAGHELLGGLADFLRQNLRPLDVVARVRNNSLAIAVHSNDPGFDPQGLFLRVIKNISRQSIRTSAGNIAITVSIGVHNVAASDSGIEPEQLLECCFSKLAQAHAGGGNRMVA